jgi:hypothetical protein
MDNCIKTLIKPVSVDSFSQLLKAAAKVVPLEPLTEEAFELMQFEKLEVPKKK